jgi:hypothetical protein
MAWVSEHAMGLVWYYEVSNSLVSEFQMVTAIQQPGHCLWQVRKPLSPQAPDE